MSFVSADGKVITRTDCKHLSTWTQAVGWMARAADIPLAPTGTAVVVRACFQFVRPKSQTERTRPHHTVKPDADKLGRALLDALTGVGYIDDAQVVELQLTKRYGPDTRTTVEIEWWA